MKKILALTFVLISFSSFAAETGLNISFMPSCDKVSQLNERAVQSLEETISEAAFRIKAFVPSAYNRIFLDNNLKINCERNFVFEPKVLFSSKDNILTVQYNKYLKKDYYGEKTVQISWQGNTSTYTDAILEQNDF